MINKNSEVKYRLIVSKESEYGSWSDVVWEGKDKWDPELEEKYSFWMNQRRPNKEIREKKEINGSKLEVNVRILDANVQISCGENKYGIREWRDHDFRAPRGDLKPSMR